MFRKKCKIKNFKIYYPLYICILKVIYKCILNYGLYR